MTAATRTTGERAAPPLRERLEPAQLPAITVLALGAGAAWLAGVVAPIDPLLIAAILVALVPAAVRSARQVLRREHGVDLIALLAMGGALALGELLAGLVIALMLTGGEALERRAAGRARRDLRALLDRAPRIAHRRDAAGTLEDIAIDRVAPGDVLVVRSGEVVPVDGTVIDETAVLDTSSLTGEPEPRSVAPGGRVESGTTNLGPTFALAATSDAARSAYAGIVRLVEAAASDRAPFTRMADRFATQLVWVTLVLAAVAWYVSGEPTRALAVVMVATPCPLIIAAPAAIVGGISRAARHGVIVKGGAALEALGQADVLLLDKTGTITAGRPVVTDVVTHGALAADALLQLAGSLDLASVHPFAPALVDAARARGLVLELPEQPREQLGGGIEGSVAGRSVRIGRLAWVLEGATGPAAGATDAAAAGITGDGVRAVASFVHVAVDGVLAGRIALEDPVRPDSAPALAALRAAGIRRIVMVSGDRQETAEAVAAGLGFDAVRGGLRPGDKVAAVDAERDGGRIIMVGDGINDAPALARADVGIAMGARGATAASEAASAVVTVDRLDAVADAVVIARGARRIALQSVLVGLGLAGIGMVLATAGLLTPVQAALLQEGIDLLVILNALRALRVKGVTRP